jgi:hypothetical protein
MKRKKDLSAYDILAHPCHSCPFAGKEPVQLPAEQLNITVSNC